MSEEEEEEIVMLANQSTTPSIKTTDVDTENEEKEGKNDPPNLTKKESTEDESDTKEDTKEEEEEEEEEEESGREKLKRHRAQVAAGHVGIPDTWGHEHLLTDWIDCSTFDFELVPKGIISARASLAQQHQQQEPSKPHSATFHQLD